MVVNGRYDIIPTLEQEQLKNDGQSMVWAKIPVILNALNSRPYEWVLFMDFDTLFTNLSITIESFLEETKETCLRPGQKWEDVSMIAAPDWYSPPPILSSSPFLYTPFGLHGADLVVKNSTPAY
jgi:galactosyl transferase GMA12/MNN10 family